MSAETWFAEESQAYKDNLRASFACAEQVKHAVRQLSVQATQNVEQHAQSMARIRAAVERLRTFTFAQKAEDFQQLSAFSNPLYAVTAEMLRANSQSLEGLHSAVYGTFQLVKMQPALNFNKALANMQSILNQCLRDIVGGIPAEPEAPITRDQNWMDQETICSADGQR